MQGDFPGPWSFKNHPWARGMHDTKHELNIGQKAAQVAYSETCLNIAFFNLDVMQRSVLYILPNQRPDAADFTARAFNPAIDLSPHIKSMFTGTSNVGHKTVGSSNLYIRGANSRSALKGIPASVLIFDEYDEMDKDNIQLAEARSDGQKLRLNWKVSTPTAPNTGINTLFERSSKDHFFFACPRCSKQIELKFPDNLVITGDDPDDPAILASHLICNECKGVLPHEAKPDMFAGGQWVSTQFNRLMRGFYINQLYSCVLPPYKLAQMFLHSKRDVMAEQEFFNSKLGLPHVVAGAQITEDMIGSLIKGYPMTDSHRPGVITMGVDVGRVLHVWIDLWDISQTSAIDINAKAKAKTLWAGEVSGIKEVSEFMTNYNVRFAVIDAMPETRMSQDFCNAFYGRVRMCRYNHYATARSAFAGENDIQVSVNRTSWLDLSLGRFRNGSIMLPNNLPRDVVSQLMAPIRKPEKDTNGNLVYKYITQDGVHDHYAHARNYSEIALMFATGNITYQTIKEKVL